MKITFLIGNGFDVGLGIKSSYSSFYEWYCDTPSASDHIAKFKQEIKEELNSDIPPEEKTWADFEIGLGKYTEKFTKETVDKYIDCYEDAQENIAQYLRSQEAVFSPNDYTDDSYATFRRSMWNFFDEVADREKNIIKDNINSVVTEHKEISVVSFNYTNSLERILEKIPNESLSTWKVSGNTFAYRLNRNIIHAHGTTSAFPILGVNDESQIANKELLETPQFKEMLLKPESVNALGELWHSRAEEQISNSRFVCVLGMSLGESDAKWWRKLNQWLKAGDKRHLIIYWYEKNPPNGVSVAKQLRCINKVKDKLLSFSNFSENEANSIRNRIHVVINTKVFLQLQKKPAELPIPEVATKEELEELLEPAL